MALSPLLSSRPSSETLSHPTGAPRKVKMAAVRPEQAPECSQDSLDPPERFLSRLRAPYPVAESPTLPTSSSHEDQAGGKHHELLVSGGEVLESEQDNLHLCLLGLGLQLQDLERGMGPWATVQSKMVQLQTLQADLRGAAERVDALVAFGEGLAQRSEPQARASLEQVVRALGAHRDSIFWRLWQLQAQLVSSSLVFEEADSLDQDLELEGTLNGLWGSWAPSSLPSPAELEWDPTGDVGGIGPLGRKMACTSGAPCELCRYRRPQRRGQGLEDLLISGLNHQKHLAGHRRHSLLQKTQTKRHRTPRLQEMQLAVAPRASVPAVRWPLNLLILLFFLLLVGATVLLPMAGDPCCSPSRLARTPYLVLSYVNGPPPL